MYHDAPLQFKPFISKLLQRLQKPLPGIEAQLRLVPAYKAELLKMQKPDRQARQSAVMIMLFPAEGEVHTTFIQRNIYDGVHSGQIAFPGGRHESTDPNLEFTALRETAEEVGVPLGLIKPIGTLTKIYIPPSNFDVLPVVGYLDSKPELVPDPSEVSGVFTVSMRHLLNPESCQLRPVKLANGMQIEVPCYIANGHTIWGATSMILSEFIAVLNETGLH
jgi:8-oxo-dGTP pyrophosphatase MutT (NUDIX family)